MNRVARGPSLFKYIYMRADRLLVSINLINFANYMINRTNYKEIMSTLHGFPYI